MKTTCMNCPATIDSEEPPVLDFVLGPFCSSTCRIEFIRDLQQAKGKVVIIGEFTTNESHGARTAQPA